MQPFRFMADCAASTGDFGILAGKLIQNILILLMGNNIFVTRPDDSDILYGAIK